MDDDYEIILVSDASPDNVWAEIEKLSQEYPIVKGYELAKNSGQPNAILAGMRCASGDLVMTADDDGQTPMNCIPQFIDEIQKGYDVACAKYTHRPKTALYRRMGSAINEKMAEYLIPRPKGIEMSTIFMAKKFVVDEMIKYDQPFAYISVLFRFLVVKIQPFSFGML